MKAILLAILILLSTVVGASALTVAWDNPSNPAIVGHTLTWHVTGDTGVTYTKTIYGADNVSVSLDDAYFQGNVSYTFTATAFTDKHVSLPSQELIHVIPGYTPPADSLPAAVYLKPAAPSQPNLI